jgi:hypothetical protein
VSWLSTLSQVSSPQPSEKPKKPRKKYTLRINHPGRGGRPVKWGNVTYQTIKECAEDIGKTTWHVRRKLGLAKDYRTSRDR